LKYETALKSDKFLVIAHGSEADISDAKEVLGRTAPETLEHHEALQQDLILQRN
jgi:hypothetical protein